MTTDAIRCAPCDGTGLRLDPSEYALRLPPSRECEACEGAGRWCPRCGATGGCDHEDPVAPATVDMEEERPCRT